MPFTCLFFRKTSVFANMVAKISSREQIHNQVQILSILKSIVHVDNKWIVELSQDLPFIHD